MIYSTIPLAAVGGVFLLWLRGMPFSVSASVGFIALFGIAVLNGIVLIEHLKELRMNGNLSMHDLIFQGTKDRLRPVMLTAGAAAMGFLPMAISTGAGAEVQRPLATVVIGGLFTSTLLTMIALPLMFVIFNNIKSIKLFPFKIIRTKECLTVLLLTLPVTGLLAQSHEISLDEAINVALQHNKKISVYQLKAEEQKALVPAAVDLEKTYFTYGMDQNNLAENDFPLHVWGMQQSFSFPTLYSQEVKARKIEYAIAESELQVQREQIVKEVSMSYIELQVLNEKSRIFSGIDSLYTHILKGATLRNKQGDISNLDLLNITARQQQTRQQLNEIRYNIENASATLKTLMGYDSSFTVSAEIIVPVHADRNIDSIPFVSQLRNQEALNTASIRIEQHKLLPDLSINYFVGTNFYENSKFYQGFETGISVPLFFGSQKAKIKASKIALDATRQSSVYEIEFLQTKQKELLNSHLKYKDLIDYYNESGSKLYDEIIRTSRLSFENGEIDYFRFAASTETALQIKLDYLDNLLNYTLVTLELNYLSK
jgi:cobalt-zinc-cadmium resistance protein CzcA